MTSVSESAKQEISELVELADEMHTHFLIQGGKLEKPSAKELKKLRKMLDHYQDWYNRSVSLIKIVIPSRIDEFQNQYIIDIKRKNVIHDSYKIQDWLMGGASNVNEYTGKKFFDDIGIIHARFSLQIQILRSASKAYDSAIINLTTELQSQILDEDLESSKLLLKNKHLRSAGTIARVVLERHLASVCANHGFKFSKKKPTGSDYYQKLKDEGVVDVAEWRRLQHLFDVGNKCAHPKDTPTYDEIEHMISGVDRTVKTLF